jgi:hypothetical protein
MSTPETDAPSEEPKSLTWGFRLLLVSSALYIAGCSAFFSVRGLGLLFVGSEIPVMVMAASLEVGKLVAASFLYRYWDRINGVMRFYLTLAVVVLIAITSLGNYGFLARAYEKTHTQIIVNEGQIANLEKEIVEINKQVEDARGKNSRVNIASREDLAKAQARLVQATDDQAKALARLQEQRKALAERRAAEMVTPNQRASEQTAAISKSIAAEEAAIAKNVAAEESTVAGLNERLKVLDQAVAAYTSQGTTSQYLFFEKDNVKKGQELREQQKPERDEILAKLTETSNRIERIRADANARIKAMRADQAQVNTTSAQETAALRATFDKELARLDSEEKDLRKSGADNIADLEKKLAALNEQGQGKVTLTETEIEKLYASVRQRNEEVHRLREQIASSDIGSYRFVARAFDAEADDVVKWLMLALVAVFDPLAVCLVVAFNMAVTQRRRAAAEAAEAQGGAGSGSPAHAHRKTPWTALEITIVVILTSVIALIAAWFFITERSNSHARGNANSTIFIPAESFAVVTFRPDELRQKSNQAFPEWLERTGGKGMSAAVAELVKNGLDPHSELYAFVKFPTQKVATPDANRPVMICGLVIRVQDPVVAEAALSRVADQMNNAIRGETGKPTSHLTRSRSMIRHGEGRYMDPEGGFFTFGLTNRTAIILVEFEGNPQAPCVEKEIRLCLTPAARTPVKGTEPRDKLPAYACTQAGALTLWFDANRFFRRLPMSAATKQRYDQLQPSLDFELLLSLSTVGNDTLRLNGSYLYQFERFNDSSPREPLKLLAAVDAPKSPDLGWKLINRCIDTIDYDAMVERMRGALGDDKAPGAQQVHVLKDIANARDAKFTMSARFDEKAGPPVMAAMSILSQ